MSPKMQLFHDGAKLAFSVPIAIYRNYTCNISMIREWARLGGEMEGCKILSQYEKINQQVATSPSAKPL